jgi:peptidoglycan/LPS O-acetylase OafA/YrhL
MLATLVALRAGRLASKHKMSVCQTETLPIAAPVCVSLATVAIIIAAQSGGAFARAMSAAPIVYVGKISYGLYLYSYPICSLGALWKERSPFHVWQFALIAISLAAAALSYEFIEKPILRLKDRVSLRQPATASVA